MFSLELTYIKKLDFLILGNGELIPTEKKIGEKVASATDHTAALQIVLGQR